jgi:hypothetical protein
MNITVKINNSDPIYISYQLGLLFYSISVGYDVQINKKYMFINTQDLI